MTKLPEREPLLADEIEHEMRKCNASLQRLSSVLSNESISVELFLEFREAVNRVRVSAWIAQKSLADRKGRSHELLLAQEWTRCIIALCGRLTEFISCHQPAQVDRIEELHAALIQLSVTLQLHLHKPPKQTH